MFKRWILVVAVLYISIILALLLLNDNMQSVISIYIALGLTGFYMAVPNEKLGKIVAVLYMGICLKYPITIMGLPTLTFGISHKNSYTELLILLFPLAFLTSIESAYLIIPAMFIAYLLKLLFIHFEEEQNKYEDMFDSFSKQTMELELKTRILIDNRNYELQNAVLSERNRIARDIHDSIGHLLTRSILQVGAMSLSAKDEKVKTGLSDISETLNNAMNQVRNSIHNIHEAAYNFESEIRELVDNFSFCSIRYDNHIENIAQKTGMAIVFVLKEALTNIAKHSNASEVKINFFEVENTKYFVIADNGNKFNNRSLEDGIGLSSMRKRIDEIGGLFNASFENGFRILIQLRGDKNENNNN